MEPAAGPAAVCYSIANRLTADIKIETSSAGTTFYVKFYLGTNAS